MRLTSRLQPAGDLGLYGTLSTPGMAFLTFPQQPISSDETHLKSKILFSEVNLLFTVNEINHIFCVSIYMPGFEII